MIASTTFASPTVLPLPMQRKVTKSSVDKAIRDAITGQRKIYLWDTEVSGFGLYASPKGSASWVFQHWIGGVGGKPRRMVFNQYPALSVEDARKESQRLRADVNKGVDMLTRKERCAKRSCKRSVRDLPQAQRQARLILDRGTAQV
jgi:hypothetical protein